MEMFLFHFHLLINTEIIKVQFKDCVLFYRKPAFLVYVCYFANACMLLFLVICTVKRFFIFAFRVCQKLLSHQPIYHKLRHLLASVVDYVHVFVLSKV